MLFNRFIFNDNAGENEGGDINAPEAEVVTDNAPESIQIPLSDLEALGFTSIDDLKAHFNKPAEPTEEQKQRNAQLEKADFLNYGTKEGLITVDEYQAFESLKAKADRDLVFENFTQEFKDDNPDAEDYEVEEAFNSQYHIDSNNVTLKKRGEKLLGKDAAELRIPVQSKYDTAWKAYGEKKQLDATIPQWNKLIDDTVGKLVPEKLKAFEKEIDGQKVSVEIELTAADREEIAEKFKMNVKAYSMFAKGENEKLSADLSRKINGYIKEKYADKIQEGIFEQAITFGKSRGSNIGATNPFPMVNNGAVVREMIKGDVETEIRKANAEAAGIRK